MLFVLPHTTRILSPSNTTNLKMIRMNLVAITVAALVAMGPQGRLASAFLAPSASSRFGPSHVNRHGTLTMGLSFPGIGRLSKSNPFPRSSSRINMSDAAIAATPDDEEKKSFMQKVRCPCIDRMLLCSNRTFD